MVLTLVAVASCLLCMGHRVASANITKTSPALFGISGYEWSAPSSDSGRARFWISAKAGMAVTPILYQSVAGIFDLKRDLDRDLNIDDITYLNISDIEDAIAYLNISDVEDMLMYYLVPVVSAPGQEVHIQRFSYGHLQKVRVTVTYHPAPQTSFNLSLGLTMTGSSTDMYYFRQNIMVVPAYTEPLRAYHGSLIMLNVLQEPPSDITPTELRINTPELKIRTLAEPYRYYISIRDGISYRSIPSSLKRNHTYAGVTTYSVDVSQLNDSQLVGRYMVSLSPSSDTMGMYDDVSALVNVYAPNSPTHGIFMLSSPPCSYYGFNGKDETPVHTWTAGLANCVCCEVMAEPTPTVSIWKEGRQLTWQQLAEGESLLEQELGKFERKVCLVVQEASEVSAGSYTCHGQAGDGSSSTHSFTVAIRQA